MCGNVRIDGKSIKKGANKSVMSTTSRGIYFYWRITSNEILKSNFFNWDRTKHLARLCQAFRVDCTFLWYKDIIQAAPGVLTSRVLAMKQHEEKVSL